MNRFISGGILLVSCFFAVLNGWSTSNPTPEPGQVVWSYSSGYTNIADFAVSKDGRVYLGFSETTGVPEWQEAGYYRAVTIHTNQLIAINHVGNFNWQTSEAGQYLAVLGDGRVLSTYFNYKNWFIAFPTGGGSGGLMMTNRFYVLNQGGSEWCPSIIGSFAAITADNDYIVSNIQTNPALWFYNGSTRIHGLENTNIWIASTPRIIGAPPAIASDGTLYLTSWGDREPIVYPNGSVQPSPVLPPALFAKNPDGSAKWSLVKDDTEYLRPAIASDGTLFLGSHQSITNRSPIDYSVIDIVEKYFFNAVGVDGSFKWTIEKSEPLSLAVVGKTNNVFVCNGTKLLALTSSGSERWSYDAEEPLKLSPALAADGTIYVATEPGKLLALDDDTGTIKWTYDAGKPIYHSPVIGTNGNVFLLVDRADMVVLAGSAEAADTAWPMERHDAQRTGRTTQASTKGVTVTEDGKFSLMLSVEPGKTYKVEASDDLETWSEIGTFTSNSAAQSFLDESSADKPQRFYRLVVP